MTPDSFSDGGLFFDPGKAVEHGLALESEGADIIDVGGESTRPGAMPVPAEEEIKRVIPVIQALSAKVKVPLSIDTYKAEVARLAIEAGASIINDISALRFDPDMVNIARGYKTPVVLMHMLGSPRDMQMNPVYDDVVQDVCHFLRERMAYVERNGIRHEDIIIDPGIGFGKTMDQNLEIIARLRELKVLGKPIVIGVSRKSFIGKLTGSPTDDRLEGSIAAAVLAIENGADIVRVHDVEETIAALRVAEAIRSATKGT